MFLNTNFCVKVSNKNKSIQSRLKSQLNIIDEKIKELELMRLYLRVIGPLNP